jgi:hypothetical protein
MKTLLVTYFSLGFLLGLLFDIEDAGSIFPRNVDNLLPDYTVLHPRIFHSSDMKYFIRVTVLFAKLRVLCKSA